MLIRRFAVLVALVAISVLGGLLAPAPVNAADPLPTRFLACDTVWGDDADEGSFRLGNNLNCTTPGLQIARSGITVDLGGHRIRGDLGDNGLRMFGEDDVTVRNGVIDNFDFNIITGDSNRVRLQNLIVMGGNNRSAIQDGSGHVITGNTFIDATSVALEDQGGSGSGQGVISGNTFVNTTIALTGTPGSTIRGNRVLGSDDAGIELTGEAEGNTISGNTVIGAATSGIKITGLEADENVVRDNTLRGNTVGIEVDNGDRSLITGNTVTGNGTGISLNNDTKRTVVSKNIVSANRGAGIALTDGADSRIIGNTSQENGGTGIFAQFTEEPVISENRVDFNGYAQGLSDIVNDEGINASGATGNGNTARGNDVDGPSQCIPAELCEDGPPDPPALTTCGLTVSADRTIHNPLVCDANTNALRLQGSGYTVNLGSHVLTAGNNATEAAIVIVAGASSIEVKGGVLMDSEHGVFMPSAGSPANRIALSKSTIIDNDSAGVLLQGVDPTPNDDVAEAGRHVITGSTMVGNGASGVLVADAPRNVLSGNTVVSAGVGFEVSRSARNVIESSRLLGNGTGIDLSNEGDPLALPIKEQIRSNSVIGSTSQGILAFNVIESSISSNTVVGSGLGGIQMAGGGSPGGSLDNVISRNRVSGGAGNGIEFLSDSSENRITANVVRAQDTVGIVLDIAADDNRLSGNTIDENGASGLVIFNPVLITEVPDVVSNNVARRNGFLSTTTAPNTGNDIGFGMDVANDTVGSGNVASGNDNPDQCDPNSFC